MASISSAPAVPGASIDSQVDPAIIKVLIVEDHPATALGVKVNLETQTDIVVVGICSRGEQVLSCVAQASPDVILLDLFLPGMTGAEVAARLRDECPSVRVLAFSAFLREDYVLSTIRAGVHGYIVKTQSNDDVINAIRTIAAGQTIFNSEVMDIVRRSLSPASAARNVNVSQEKLTEREMQVLELLADDLADKEIADRLNIEVTTVKTHVHHILEKLGVENREQAALIYRTSPKDRAWRSS